MMGKHDWLVSVLDDLETYAKENEFSSLSEELSKTKRVARAEVAFDANVTLHCADNCRCLH